MENQVNLKFDNVKYQLGFRGLNFTWFLRYKKVQITALGFSSGVDLTAIDFETYPKHQN